MIDITRRQFGLGLLGGLTSLLVNNLSSAQSPPVSSPVPAGKDPDEPLDVEDAGDHMTRLHLNLADDDDDGEVTTGEWNRYLSTLGNRINFTGYTLGDLRQMREGIALFDAPGRFGIYSLGRMAASTILEFAITEKWNKWPVLTSWVASLGEAYYYSYPYSLSPIQIVLLNTPLLTLEHWIGAGSGRGVYDFLYGREVRGTPIGVEAQIGRFAVSNVAREAAHYGVNLLVDLVPPMNGRLIII